MPAVCSVDGCPEVAVERGRCAAHPAPRKRSPSSSVTGTRRWRKVKALVLERDGYVCAYCGGPATTVDHVKPVARGGAEYDPANLVAACESCNLAKGARPSDSIVDPADFGGPFPCVGCEKGDPPGTWDHSCGL